MRPRFALEIDLLSRLKARRDWHDWIAAAIMVLLVAAGIWAAQGRSAAFMGGGGIVVQLSETPAAPPHNLPAPPVEPVQYVAVSPQDALKINEAIPFSTLPNPAAKPFKLA